MPGRRADGAPTVFTLALVAAAGLSVALAAWATRGSRRPRLRTAGLVVTGLGVVASVMAWALPLWMSVLGAGFVLLGVASAPGQRRALALLASGQLIGLAVGIAGAMAQLGGRDEWGDYPVAGAIASAVTATIMIVALVELTRSLPPLLQAQPATPGAVSRVS